MSPRSSIFLLLAVIASAPVAAQACCQIVESLPDEAPVVGDAAYDAKDPIDRFLRIGETQPSRDVMKFLGHVDATYLAPQDRAIVHLKSADLAKLIGFAVGEAATKPAPVDVFAPQFRSDLEHWIVRLGVQGRNPYIGGDSVEASVMWRLVEEGARGFYDDEMRAAYGSVTDDPGPTSVEAWFQGLSGAEKDRFLRVAANAGLSRENGAPYSVAEFNAVSILMDGEFGRQNLTAEQRREAIRKLAAGERYASAKE